jgi:acid phosphatase type 7
MGASFASKTQRALRYGLVAVLVGAGLWACGGGGGNTAPTQVQPNPTSSWELITAGDIAQCDLQSSSKSNAEKTAQLVERQLADAGANSNVLTLGDNAYLVGLLLGYTECYEKTWGRFINKTFAIPGNHDYENNGEKNYFNYFGAKASPGPSAGPDRSGYYRIDQNGWTVFTLNSNIDATASSVQAQWLKQQLATAQPCIAAAWHHARFTSAPDGDSRIMTDIWDILDQAKADVVLQAHEHQYERFAPMTSTGAIAAGSGIRSFVVGTGGADIYAHASVRAGSEKQLVTYGVMRLSLSAGNAKWRFVDVNNATLDQGAFACRNK